MVEEQSVTGPRFRQGLPRPAGASRLEVPTAGFTTLSAEQVAFASSLSGVKEALFGLGPLDGLERGKDITAAVLVALGWAEGDKLRVLFIRRASHLRQNPSEIAFPGGRLEEKEGVVEAALREAEEEVGLDPLSVRVLGRLPVAWRRSRRGEIAPVVGLVEGAPELEANAEEVDELFCLPLEKLYDPRFYWEENWAARTDEDWSMQFFDLGEDLLWGASARILVSLLETLASHAKYARPARQEPSGDSHG